MRPAHAGAARSTRSAAGRGAELSVSRPYRGFAALVAGVQFIDQITGLEHADDDLDIDPALAACVQFSLAGPHLAPDSPSAPPPMTLSAFGMNLHAATTADGRDRKQLTPTWTPTSTSPASAPWSRPPASS